MTRQSNEGRGAMRPKNMTIRYILLGLFITLPFFLCSFMEVAR